MRASPDLRTGILSISPAGILPRRAAKPGVETVAFPAKLDAFQNQGNSLTHTDAHGAKRISAVGAQELIERRGYQPRAASAQRVPDSNRTTVGIDVRRVVWNFQLAQHCQRL